MHSQVAGAERALGGLIPTGATVRARPAILSRRRGVVVVFAAVLCQLLFACPPRSLCAHDPPATRSTPRCLEQTSSCKSDGSWSSWRVRPSSLLGSKTAALTAPTPPARGPVLYIVAGPRAQDRRARPSRNALSAASQTNLPATLHLTTHARRLLARRQKCPRRLTLCALPLARPPSRPSNESCPSPKIAIPVSTCPFRGNWTSQASTPHGGSLFCGRTADTSSVPSQSVLASACESVHYHQPTHPQPALSQFVLFTKSTFTTIA
jgi:hypothetical protein